MKFKIKKSPLDFLNSGKEIELELVADTATEAIMLQQVNAEWFHKGYHQGFKEGYYARKNDEYRMCKCGCGGNNCGLRFCDNLCPYYNK